LVLTGQLDDVGNTIRTNSGSSYRIGLELETVIPVSSKFAIQSNMTLSTNKNEETIVSRNGAFVNLGKTDISFSPDIVASNAFVYQPMPSFQMSLLSKFVGDQFMSNTEAELSRLDSYFTTDFNVSYTIEPKSIFDSIVITGLVNNIFNEEYINNGYYFTFDDDFSNPGTITTIEGAGFYPQATANFLLGVTLNF